MRLRTQLLIPLVLLGCSALGLAQQDKPKIDPPPVPANDYSPQDWKEYSSAEGRFKVLFPGVPKEINEKLESSAGSVDFHLVAYNSFITYAVVFTDYNTNLEDPAVVKRVLDNAREGSLSRVATEEPHIVKEIDLLVDGHPGRFLQVVLKGDAVVRVKFFAVKNRLYGLTVGTPKGRPNVQGAENDYEKIAMSFLDSFKIIPPANADPTHGSTGSVLFRDSLLTRDFSPD